MLVSGLPIPSELVSLIDCGRWPRSKKEANSQHTRPIVPASRIREFDRVSPGLFLLPPPFVTLRRRIESGHSFWLAPMAAPTEVVHDLSVDIADFGLGSDSPIILDYSADRSSPSVKYLRWSSTAKRDKHWELMFRSFAEFAAAMLA